MRVTTVNPIAAYAFLLLSMGMPLILYQKLSKQREKLKYANYRSQQAAICQHSVLSIDEFKKNLDYHFLSNFVKVQQHNQNIHISTVSEQTIDQITDLKIDQTIDQNIDQNNAQNTTSNLTTIVSPELVINNHEKLKDYSQDGQSKFIDNYLKHKECGNFVEVGAADGEIFSNTLFLETTRNWQGVLIEPNEEMFKTLVGRNRTRSVAMQACVGPVTADGVHADMPFNFKPLGDQSTSFLGGLVTYLEMVNESSLRDVYSQKFGGGYTSHTTMTTCINLEKLLPDSLKIIDYLSIDTEGSELAIIESISEEFWKDRVRLVSVDVSSADGEETKLENARNLAVIMKDLGFKLLEVMKHDAIYVNFNKL